MSGNNMQKQILKSTRASAQIILQEVDELQIFITSLSANNNERFEAYSQVKKIRRMTCAILATDDGPASDPKTANYELLMALLNSIIDHKAANIHEADHRKLSEKLSKTWAFFHRTDQPMEAA